MGEMVSYRHDGTTSEGYLAIPSGGATSPAVIVIQERWGLVPHVTSVADRFAEAGFVAFAPDLHHGAVTEGADEAGRLMTALRMDDAAADVDAAAGYLADRPDVSGGVGCVGFCAGGSLALWSATVSDRIVATAGFYPVLPWAEMRPGWADYAGKAAVIHCAEADGASAAEGVQAARRAIESAGGTCVLHDYPGTAHSFFNDDRPEVFDQRAAASAWARTLEHFRSRLG
ncbi:dienelactone hydrolase family protein [Micromonospora sp. NBRC 101691]|uniref:dienelactone hydrolase family protein n=1 Tax=Micromonospora sp. NBRC 101691 TaxID=3032198 RepID=UPI0024A36084|nr:dienelactone hydrolase family protein [Micromonospora sp. NBRC 101691]GLY22019.1 putative carboxymethylenebutenolidase [Micromonospora sp. NBRC 101691]